MRRQLLVFAFFLSALTLVSANGADAPLGGPRVGALTPMARLPSVSKVSADEYYILLLKWTRAAKVGPVTARVTYLNPDLYLSWLRQSDPNISQASFDREMGGFPEALRFRIAYQAEKRTDLPARGWKLSLVGPHEERISSELAKRIAPIDLKSGASGDYWEDVWECKVKVPEHFLSQAKVLTVKLSGPSGSALVDWRFGASEEKVRNPAGYVGYLGGVLLVVCAALGVALFGTRTGKEDET